MKAIKNLKIAGILVLILGIIHICATPLVLHQMNLLPLMQKLCFLFMFVCTGLATILIGWLQYFLARQSKIDLKSATILKVSIWLMLLIGIGAVATMWNNPFAYISLLIALYELIILISLPKPYLE
jgi:hypothetical protein